MHYWKWIVLVAVLCVAVILYNSLAHNNLQATAVVEQVDYQKQTGVLVYTLSFRDHNGLAQQAKITKHYMKGSSSVFMKRKGDKVKVLYNQRTPWKAELDEAGFPWLPVFWVIAAIMAGAFVRFARFYSMRSD